MRGVVRLQGQDSNSLQGSNSLQDSNSLQGSNSLQDSPRAWAVAVAGLAINTWTFGVFYSFGPAFEQITKEFDSGLGATAAVFSITTFFFFAGGIVSGPMADKYGPRPLVIFGAVAMTVGLVATASVEQLWLAYVTYGVGVGAGIAAYLVPMTACVGGWFDKRRSMALGLYTSGIGFGTFLIVPAAQALIEREGWRFAFRVMGLGSLLVFGLAAIFISRPPMAPAAGVGPRRTWSQVIALPYFKRVYCAGLLMTTALFVPFVFIVKYATERGVSDAKAAVLISVIGVGSVIGRLGLGALGTRFSVFKLAFISYAVQPVTYLIWLISDGSYPLLLLFTAVLGAAYGGFVALSPVLSAQLYGLEGLGAVLGLQYTSAGVGGLIGPIAAGVLLDQSDSFSLVISVAIALCTVATVIFWPLQSHR